MRTMWTFSCNPSVLVPTSPNHIWVYINKDLGQNLIYAHILRGNMKFAFGLQRVNSRIKVIKQPLFIWKHKASLLSWEILPSRSVLPSLIFTDIDVLTRNILLDTLPKFWRHNKLILNTSAFCQTQWKNQADKASVPWPFSLSISLFSIR